jgi:enoyl-CoA hydratase/carnithine racemase
VKKRGDEIMSEGTVTVERRGHVLLMGLDRTDKLNAVDLAMFRELATAYGELERDQALRCGVVFAHGKHFTAGVDLMQWAPVFASGQLPEIPDGAIDPLGFDDERRVSKPIVMAAQGLCLTIGIELMLSTDIRVAAKNTRFAQIEIKRGIYPVGGATVRFIQEVGWSNAMRYLLTGDEFRAREAHRMGLVQEVVATGEQLDRAVALAETIAAQAPLGVCATLKSARLARRQGEAAAFARLLPDLGPIMASEDAQEGVMSFLERREARFAGR